MTMRTLPLVMVGLLCGCSVIHRWSAPRTPTPAQHKPPSALHRPTPPIPPSTPQLVPEPMVLAVAVQGANPVITFGWTPSTAPNIGSQTFSYGVQSTVYTNSTMLAPPINQFVVTNLLWATTYYFAVKCTDINGLSSLYSTELMYTTTNLPPTPPAPPTNLKIISVQ